MVDPKMIKALRMAAFSPDLWEKEMLAKNDVDEHAAEAMADQIVRTCAKDGKIQKEELTKYLNKANLTTLNLRDQQWHYTLLVLRSIIEKKGTIDLKTFDEIAKELWPKYWEEMIKTK